MGGRDGGVRHQQRHEREQKRERIIASDEDFLQITRYYMIRDEQNIAKITIPLIRGIRHRIGIVNIMISYV